LAEEVRRWVIEGPAQQGLDHAGWTHEELADHLLKTQGTQTSRSAVQRYCAKIGIRVYRPTFRYGRGDPPKQAQTKQEIAELKKSGGRRSSPTQPGRSPLSHGADVGRYARSQRTSADGRDA
jgi:hypothetical protein